MTDPLSIAGVTIAIFDQLLKLGERSAELAGDIRAFPDVSSQLVDRACAILPRHVGVRSR